MLYCRDQEIKLKVLAPTFAGFGEDYIDAKINRDATKLKKALVAIAGCLKEVDRILEQYTPIVQEVQSVGSCKYCKQEIVSGKYCRISCGLFHANCFVCDVCHVGLQKEEFYIKNDIPVCKLHAT